MSRLIRVIRDHLFSPFPPLDARAALWLAGELDQWHRDWPLFEEDQAARLPRAVILPTASVSSR
jgi:hypothetical protein